MLDHSGGGAKGGFASCTPASCLGYGCIGVTNIYWVYIAVMVRVHVTVWEQAIGEEGKKHKFWEG